MKPARDSLGASRLPIRDSHRNGGSIDVAELAAALREHLPAPVTGLLDAAQAAELLAVPKSWVLTEAREGRIPHVRLGPRYVRFDAVELREWWSQRRVAPSTGSHPVSRLGDPR